MPTLSQDTTAAMNRKLEILINLMAYQMVGDMTIAEGAPILRRLGMSPTEIATVFDSTTKSVRTRLKEAKRRTTKKKGK